jgi:hypothetical protein
MILSFNLNVVLFGSLAEINLLANRISFSHHVWQLEYAKPKLEEQNSEGNFHKLIVMRWVCYVLDPILPPHSLRGFRLETGFR